MSRATATTVSPRDVRMLMGRANLSHEDIAELCMVSTRTAQAWSSDSKASGRRMPMLAYLWACSRLGIGTPPTPYVPRAMRRERG